MSHSVLVWTEDRCYQDHAEILQGGGARLPKDDKISGLRGHEVTRPRGLGGFFHVPEAAPTLPECVCSWRRQRTEFSAAAESVASAAKAM